MTDLYEALLEASVDLWLESKGLTEDDFEAGYREWQCRRSNNLARRRHLTTQPIRANHWEPHEMVEIRSFREADNQWIQDQLAETIMQQNGAQPEQQTMAYRLGKSRLYTMLRGIVAWTLTDEAGNRLEVNAKNIGDLAPEDADFIYQAISNLNKPMTQGEGKASSATAGTGLQADPSMSQIPS